METTCLQDLLPPDPDYNPQVKRAKSPSAQISPLLINHVLEQVFHEACLSDLKSFRLVCREWNRVATKSLQSMLDLTAIGCRNTTHVHSLNYDSCETSTPELVTRVANIEKLNSFIKVISQSTNPPFIKFDIVSTFFIPENQSVIQRFLECVGPFIQVLKISLDNRTEDGILDGEFTPQFLANLTFQKLRSVIFEVNREFALTSANSTEPDEEAENAAELRGNAVSYRILSSISFGATSLESLEVSLQRKCNADGRRRYNLDGTPNFERDRMAGLGGGGICPCQHFLADTPPLASPSPPVELHLDASVVKPENSSESRDKSNSITTPATASSNIVKCHLPLPLATGYQTTPPRISNSSRLKKLHLRLRNSFIHQNCVNSLFERLANTLEELCVTEEGHGSRVAVQFPTMTRLSHLTISSICEFEQNYVTILPFSYSEQLPRLASLNLWDCFGTEDRYEKFFMSRSPSYSLTKLVFPSQFRNATLAQNIPNVFPRLKSVTLVFSTRTDNLAVIETIFKCCGESLEELHFITDMDTQNQNVDHVLTGLPKEICRKMRMEENYMLPLYMQGIARKASLVNLKRLKRLIFQLEHKYSRAPLITDVTGYLAFMEMPNLSYLRFTRYGMTWTCCEALSKKCRVDILSPHANNVFEIENFDFDFDGV